NLDEDRDAVHPDLKAPEKFCARSTGFQYSTREFALLKIGPGRSGRVEHDRSSESHKVRRAANVRDARPNRSPDRCFGCGSSFVLFGKAMGKKPNKESGNGEHGRCNDEKIRRTNFTHIMLGDVGAEDRTESATDSNEAVKAFTLFDSEQVRHERPENGSVKQVENTDPNKETAHNPYVLRTG